jgi:hypothetical protein
MDEIIQKIIDKIIITTNNGDYKINNNNNTTTLLTLVIKQLPDDVFWYKFIPLFSLSDQEILLKIKEPTD